MKISRQLQDRMAVHADSRKQASQSFKKTLSERSESPRFTLKLRCG
jgi:hypothetical protein